MNSPSFDLNKFKSGRRRSDRLPARRLDSVQVGLAVWPPLSRFGEGPRQGIHDTRRGAAVGELPSAGCRKHPLQHRRQQRGVGLADGGVLGFEGGDFGLQAVEGLLGG